MIYNSDTGFYKKKSYKIVFQPLNYFNEKG